MNEHDTNLLNNLLSKYQANQANQILILTRLPVFFFPIFTVVVAVSVYMPDMIITILMISALLSLMLFLQYLILIIEESKIYFQIRAVERGENETEIRLVERKFFCFFLSASIHALFILFMAVSIGTVFYLVSESDKGKFEKNTNITKELKAPSSQNFLP